MVRIALAVAVILTLASSGVNAQSPEGQPPEMQPPGAPPSEMQSPGGPPPGEQGPGGTPEGAQPRAGHPLLTACRPDWRTSAARCGRAKVA